MQFNVGHTVLEVAIALGEVHLEQVAQEVLQIRCEVGGETDLYGGRGRGGGGGGGGGQWQMKCLATHPLSLPRNICRRWQQWNGILQLYHLYPSCSYSVVTFYLPFQRQSSHKSEWAGQQRTEGSQLPFHRSALPVPTSPLPCCSPMGASHALVSRRKCIPGNHSKCWHSSVGLVLAEMCYG